LEEKELREESDAKVQALMRRIKELEEIAQRTNNQTITNTSIQMNGNGNQPQPQPISSKANSSNGWKNDNDNDTCPE